MRRVADMYIAPNGDDVAHAIQTHKWLRELTAGFYNDRVWPTAAQVAKRARVGADDADRLLKAAAAHQEKKQEYNRELRRWLSALKNDNAQGEYYLTDIIVMAAKDGLKIHGAIAPTETEVLGVNDKVQLAELESALRAERAKALMLEGATIADPARIDIRGKVTVGRDVFIDVGVVLEGRVVLGDRVRLEAYAVVRNCTLGVGTVVHPHCHLESSAIGDDCEIGPFSRLRPGVVLSGHVKVGNFVEMKNSHVAPHSKVNHLTYVGDTTVGTKVNVGAGTITCNYDGANKHRTVIGDNAFIGSGVMLVAPVEVGAGATIGAGSTITKDTPPEELTVARSKQVTISGWKRPQKKPK